MILILSCKSKKSSGTRSKVLISILYKSVNLFAKNEMNKRVPNWLKPAWGHWIFSNRVAVSVYYQRIETRPVLFHFSDNLLDLNPRIFEGFLSQFVIQGWLAVDTFIFLGLVSLLPLFLVILYNQQFVLFLLPFHQYQALVISYSIPSSSVFLFINCKPKLKINVTLFLRPTLNIILHWNGLGDS